MMLAMRCMKSRVQTSSTEARPLACRLNLFNRLTRNAGSQPNPPGHVIRAVNFKLCGITGSMKAADHCDRVDSSICQAGSLMLLSPRSAITRCTTGNARASRDLVQLVIQVASVTNLTPPLEYQMGPRQPATWSSLPESLAARILRHAFQATGRSVQQRLQLSLVCRRGCSGFY